ncbi:SLC13 family permease [Nocardioides zeae]|uniref:SLC13 family permease n=1 Tax=Nocardioides imazamoxiresistens TaxID=3231893 RepID=A0ABU3PY51_9ACTN|nr:SLC13 family permease [Nocardioides zeae]MDT9594079.1 SLC13 family permease [Nocardioides zeae]
MTYDPLFLHTAITIVGIIVLIVVLKIHPMFSLLAGVLYLGIASGLGLDDTLNALTLGFGDILAEIGLLIAFGITLGTALNELGAIERVVRGLVKVFGKRKSPYAIGLTAGTALQPIFADVMLVVTAPIARGLARTSGDRGIPRLAAALVTGILVGLTMMIPSVGSLALAGVIDVPLWRYLLIGGAVGAITIVVTIFLMTVLIERTRFWNPEKDEDRATMDALDGIAPDDEDLAGPGGSGAAGVSGGAGGAVRTPAPAVDAPVAAPARTVPVLLAGVPVIAALLLVAAGSLSDVFGVENALLTFLSAPTVALLIGAFGAVLLVRWYRGQAGVKRALDSSFSSLGEVLVLTGLGGALAGLVKATGLGDVLGELFESSAGPPILLAWTIAMVLHVAIGSVSVAAITAAGILGPAASSAGVDPILVALAAAAGALFLMTVHSNFFWMAKNLLGQTTSGAVKVVGASTSIASVVGLGVVLALSLVL